MKLMFAAPLAALLIAAPAPLVLAQGNDDLLSAAPPAAYSVSREEALSIARAEGMTRLKEIERDDGKWEIEGCTADRREIEIDIRRSTGEIVKLEIDDRDDDDC